MKYIYCLSGLSADEKMFSRLKFEGYEVHFMQWIVPEKNEHIEGYAKRLIVQIHHQNPVLLGLSFGGMMCIEIAKQLPVEKIIIISSISSYNEMPYWMRLCGKLGLDKLIPIASLPFFEPIRNNNLGLETPEEKELVKYYRKNVNPHYAAWSVKTILNWKNEWLPENLFHIHGNKDKIFPVRKIKTKYLIKDGGHFMILNRADKVNEYIKAILSNI